MFGARWRFLRPLAIPISVDASWLIVLALLTLSLATGFPAMLHEHFPGATHELAPAEYRAMGLVTALSFFGCIPLHELGHAVVAKNRGMPIRGITLFLFGGVAELGDEPSSAATEFLMAVAGPIVSILPAIGFRMSAGVGYRAGWPHPVVIVLGYLAAINALALAFNMVPAFPLDGGRVPRSILWSTTGNLRRAAPRAALGFAGCPGLRLVSHRRGADAVLAGNWLGGTWSGMMEVFLNWEAPLTELPWQPRTKEGRTVLTMLEALARRGPDSAGAAVIGPGKTGEAGNWSVRIAPDEDGPLSRLGGLGELVEPRDGGAVERGGGTLRFDFRPAAGVTPASLERALGARRGGPEVLSLGHGLDLIKDVGPPAGLEASYGLSSWSGMLAIGHTRMSTESRIDLSHSQPFWVHGVADLATVHNGHVTNYHQLRRRFEQEGATFHTDNDSEVIGVYLRSRMERGRGLVEAMADSVVDLDGAFSYLVAAPMGLGIVRDRFGFKPLMLTETDEFVAVATEEIALRRAVPLDFRAAEPAPGSVLFFPIPLAA
jgi:Zn-dependent protease